jgi:hypothetical protein
MHAVKNHHQIFTSANTTHFTVKPSKEEAGSSGGSDSASIDVVVVRGGDEEHDEEEHHYFAPEIRQNGAHVESNPSYVIMMPDGSQKRIIDDEKNPYFNPNYISRATSAADSVSNHYSTNGTPIDHLPPHYYEVSAQQLTTSSSTTVNLIPLALVDREVHSRRVSALILPSPPEHKFTRNSQPLFSPQQAARTGRRRFSVTNNGASAARKMAGEEVHYAQSNQHMLPPVVQSQKETLGRRAAQKFLQQKGAFRRAKPNGSKLFSELSQSASALYSLFTTSNDSGGSGAATRNSADSDDDLEFDRRSVLSVDHLHFNQSHYQQPILSHQVSLDKTSGKEQIYASTTDAQMSSKALIALANSHLMDVTVECV